MKAENKHPKGFDPLGRKSLDLLVLYIRTFIFNIHSLCVTSFRLRSCIFSSSLKLMLQTRLRTYSEKTFVYCILCKIAQIFKVRVDFPKNVARICVIELHNAEVLIYNWLHFSPIRSVTITSVPHKLPL